METNEILIEQVEKYKSAFEAMLTVWNQIPIQDRIILEKKLKDIGVRR